MLLIFPINYILGIDPAYYNYTPNLGGTITVPIQCDLICRSVIFKELCVRPKINLSKCSVVSYELIA